MSQPALKVAYISESKHFGTIIIVVAHSNEAAEIKSIGFNCSLRRYLSWCTLQPSAQPFYKESDSAVLIILLAGAHARQMYRCLVMVLSYPW